MQISELITKGYKILKENNISTPLLDSEVIISEIVKIDREKLIYNEKKTISSNEIKEFFEKIKRRSTCEPVAYVLNKKPFWKNNFYVNKYTLIPRPETELMVERVLTHYRFKNLFILDVGTGSGCIILSILKDLKNSYGIGIDTCKNAIKIANKNAKILKIESRVKFYHKSISARINNRFDLIISNPPYVRSLSIKKLSNDIKKFEPKIALDGGNDGLDVIKKVIYKSKYILKKNGLLALEVGNGQYRKVSKVLECSGFREKFLIKDYNNNVRCIFSVLK